MSLDPVKKRSLRELAQLRGVQLQYLDSEGRRVMVDDEVLVAVLAALGEPLGDGRDSVEALESAKARRHHVPLEPVIAKRHGRLCMTTLTLPREVDCSKIQVTLGIEDGSEMRALMSDARLKCAVSRHDDESVYRYSFCAVPGKTPPGYHTLRIEGPDLEAEALVIAAPSICPQPDRSWGTFIPLYALRRESGDLGVGSFRDLGDLGHWTNAQGGSFVATLPLLAHFVDSSGTYMGPYLPASKLAWNEAYVELGSLPELDSDDRWAASARQQMDGVRRVMATQQTGPGHADIASVLRLKRPVLELLARSLYESSNTRRKDFEEYLVSKSDVLQYARFRAATESTRSRWQDWPTSGSHEIPSSPTDEDAVRYHLYSQWVSDQQLAECGESGLYLDIPVGVDPSGFDTWLAPGSFVGGVSGGAPPDAFFSEGQSWGFPPLHPDGIRNDRYRYVIACLRHMMTHAAMLRLDHVMGLHRMYCVPDGFEPRQGAYVGYHADEMHAVLVLEASRSNTVIVGEDLGTVPSAVRTDMARDGILSSFVMQFESTETHPFPVPKRRSLATLGTHDLPTFEAYWNGQDIAEQQRQGRIDAERATRMQTARALWRTAALERLNPLEHLSPSDGARSQSCSSAGGDHDHSEPAPSGVHQREQAVWALRGFLEHLGRSPASVVQVDLEDLWLEPDQQNRPGTPAGSGSFTRRASRTMEEMEADPTVLDLLRGLDKARSEDPAQIARDVER